MRGEIGENAEKEATYSAIVYDLAGNWRYKYNLLAVIGEGMFYACHSSNNSKMGNKHPDASGPYLRHMPDLDSGIFFPEFPTAENCIVYCNADKQTQLREGFTWAVALVVSVVVVAVTIASL